MFRNQFYQVSLSSDIKSAVIINSNKNDRWCILFNFGMHQQIH